MSADRSNDIGVFILTRNEEQNIGKSLEALASSGWPVQVMDSGSFDKTEEIVERYPFASFVPYRYRSHYDAYNEIITDYGAGYGFVLIIDADMVIGPDFQAEIAELVSQVDRSWAVLDAEIEMLWDGRGLKHASLCPPKSFLFETGHALFVRHGHAEKLAEGISVHRTRHKIVHDDRKPYAKYLESQLRYGDNLIQRYAQGQVSWKDRVRLNSPLLLLAVPFVSYVIQRGFLDGRAGLLYALDRLIAEAIMYRQAVASRGRRDGEETPRSG